MKTVQQIANETNRSRSRSRVTVVIDQLGITKHYRKEITKSIIIITDEDAVKVIDYFKHTKANEKKHETHKFSAGVNAMLGRDIRDTVLRSSWNIGAWR